MTAYGFDENLNKITVKDKASQDAVDSGQNDRLTALESGKADTGHTHDDRYYTESEVNNKLEGRLPNFVNQISMTNGGNPRQVKFISVDYNTKATYFKMSAMCCHDNGTSYQFLEDIIIGVTTSGTVTCNVYKYCQQSCGTASYNLVDGLERQYGDVFYVKDETNKVVDFFILIGQYSVSQYTPPTKIGLTTLAYVTPMTGGAVYYSSGTRVWANGNGCTYVNMVDDVLDGASTNPLQNKVIYNALAGKADSSHTHSYLPLSGGTVSDTIIISGSNPHLGLSDTSGSVAYFQTYDDGSGLKAGFGYGWVNSMKLDGNGNIFGVASIYQNGKQVANKEDVPTITISASDPSGGSNGDIWLKYE